PLGRRESVEKLTRDALLGYYRRQYWPGQMVLAISGDVKSAAVLAHVERIFGGLPMGTAETPALPALPAMSATRQVFTVPGAQAQIFMGALAPPFTDPDYPALKVMTAILCGGHAYRLIHT